MAIADVSGKSIAELVSFAGRGAVVTGGATGLGKAMVRRLAEAGAGVLIADIDIELAQTTAAQLAASTGGKVLATRLDVADSASIVAAAELALAEFGSLDIWVNNAALYPSIPLMEKRSLERRPHYQDVIDRVPMLLPRPPRKAAR